MEWPTLFFSVWKNIYLNKQIFIQLGLLRDHSMNKRFTICQLKNYKYKEYSQKVLLINKEGELIVKGDLPNSGYLKSINFIANINLTGDLFPDGIEHIGLSYTNTQSLEMLCNGLPSSVTSIGFLNLNKCAFSNCKKLIETTNITSIILGKEFTNQKLQCDLFPCSIKKLSFPSFWNNANCPLEIGDIPLGIETLDISSYCQEIGFGVLPNSVTSLVTSHPYSQYHFKVGSFPESIKKLIIISETSIYEDDKCFIGIDTIPKSTTYLGFETCEVVVTPGSLPDSLKTLEINNLISDGVIESNVLPPFLESLLINYPTNIQCSLPITLATFHFNVSPSSQSILSDTEFLSNLKSLTNLRLSNIHDISIGFIPINNSINKLELFFSNEEFELVNGIIPISSVGQKLVFSGYTKKLKQYDIPNTVTSLSFGYEYHAVFEEGVLPIGLLEFEIPLYYNKPIKSNVLPISLTLLNGNLSMFNQQFEIDSLPVNLKSLSLASYDHPIPSLPINLTYLKLLSINHTITLPPNLKTLVLNEKLRNTDLLFLFGNDYILPPLLEIKYCK